MQQRFPTVLCVIAGLALFQAIPAPVMAQVADSTFWIARDTTIGADAARAKVRIAIWDSGVDTVLFRDRLARDGQGWPLIRGYDAFKERQDLPLAVLPDSIAQRSAQLNRWLCAMDDIDSGVDSPQARELSAWLDTITEAREEAFYGTIER